MNDLGPLTLARPGLLPAVAILGIGPTSWGLVRLLRAAGLRGPALAAALLATGCSTPNVGADVLAAGMPNAELALRESMRLVDAEMSKLGVMGPAPVERFSVPVVPGELQKVVVFAWDGALEEGVRKLADGVGYLVAVVPPPPGSAPVRVGIATGQVQVIQAFQALGEAAGARATVRVDPAARRVDVIYRA